MMMMIEVLLLLLLLLLISADRQISYLYVIACGVAVMIFLIHPLSVIKSSTNTSVLGQ